MPKCNNIDTKIHCNSKQICEWNNINNTCRSKCNVINNGPNPHDNCTINWADCTWQQMPNESMKCVQKCHTVGNELMCNVNSNCRWNIDNNTCQPKCHTITNSNLCDLNGFNTHCMWYTSPTSGPPGSCVSKCNAINKQETCYAHEHCKWNDDNNSCILDCNNITNLTKCGYAAHCQWNSVNNSCIFKK